MKNNISKTALEDIKNLLNKNYDTSQDIKLRDETPKNLVELGLANLPMLMNSSHILDNILTISEAKKQKIYKKNKNYHGLGVKNYLEAINLMDEAIAIYRWNDKEGKKYNSKNYVVLLDKKINGESIIIPIYAFTKGNYNNTEISTNKIKTVYSSYNIKNILNIRVKKGEMIKVYSNKKSNVTTTLNTDVTTSLLTNDNISQNNTSVKLDTLPITYYENQNKNNTFIKEDIVLYGY